MKLKRFGAGLALVASVVACGGPTVAVAAPDYYGEGGRCYYVRDVSEVYALQRAGRCPMNWTPMVMPDSWHSRYSFYYDSPTYYNAYVPPNQRTTYVKVVHSWESSHPNRVRSAPARPVSNSKFNAGNGRPSGGDAGTSRVTTRTSTRVSTGTSPRSTSKFNTGRK